MSKFPFDRSWLSEMSDRLLRCAGELRVDNKVVTFEELVSSDTLLNEVRHALKRHGWPSRTPEEIRQELLRLQGRWKPCKYKTEASRRVATNNPYLWVDDSEDDDDNFMPSVVSSKGKSAASSKGKSAASSEGKSDASSKGKSAASSKRR